MPVGVAYNRKQIIRNLIILISISTVVRALIAGLFELGNDEVYYWTYAKYPDLSHFDHPPMVGWLISLFSLNLHFQQEFFLRLASVIGGAFNTWFIFLIGWKLRDELTGWYAAILYTATIYGFVITGIFILPDTPQTFFWLLALILMLDVVPRKEISRQDQMKMLMIGILLGLGMLSKYTTAFLWLGFVIFILTGNRHWTGKWSFYAANLLMVLFFLPVIAWNFHYDFVSFNYQGGRAGISGELFRPGNFLTEIGGELLYQNPIIVVVIVIALFAVFRHKIGEIHPGSRLLIYSALPVILIFLLISMFRATLPHWSGPGYMTLIPLAALWIREKKGDKASMMPGVISQSLILTCLVISLSILQITTGFIRLWPSDEKAGRMGERDFSLEVYGWEMLGKEFKTLATACENRKEIEPSAPIITYRWFPAANLEYYVAEPSGRDVLACGELSEIHKYAWINRLKGGFLLNTDAWYITSSRDFRDPRRLPLYFEEISSPDTIPVKRNGRTAYRFYVYRMINMQSQPGDILGKSLKR